MCRDFHWHREHLGDRGVALALELTVGEERDRQLPCSMLETVGPLEGECFKEQSRNYALKDEGNFVQ